MSGVVDVRGLDPLFSVVVPVYNAGRYLEECLESISSQAFDFDSAEVILVDDGSTDGSLAVERAFVDDASLPVRLIEQPNGGPYIARETGVEAARGTYVLFCDADDAFLPGCFSRIRSELQSSDYDVVVFGASTEPDGSLPLLRSTLREATFEGAGKAPLIEAAAVGFEHNNLWNKAIRRNLLLGLDPVHPRRFGEDLYVVMQVFDAARRIRFIDDCLYFYRQTPGSITQTYGPQSMQDIETTIDKAHEILGRWGLAEHASAALLGKECWLCAKAIESILSSDMSTAGRIGLLEELANCRFAQEGARGLESGKVQGSEAGLLRVDLALLVSLLSRRKYGLLRACYLMLSGPKKIWRTVARRGQ